MPERQGLRDSSARITQATRQLCIRLELNLEIIRFNYSGYGQNWSETRTIIAQWLLTMIHIQPKGMGGLVPVAQALYLMIHHVAKRNESGTACHANSFRHRSEGNHVFPLTRFLQLNFLQLTCNRPVFLQYVRMLSWIDNMGILPYL